jgi:hypothetical protein
MWLRRMRMGRSLLFVMGCLPPLLNLTAFRYVDKNGAFWPGSTKSTRPNHVFPERLFIGSLARRLAPRTKVARVQHDE